MGGKEIKTKNQPNNLSESNSNTAGSEMVIAASKKKKNHPTNQKKETPHNKQTKNTKQKNHSRDKANSLLLMLRLLPHGATHCRRLFANKWVEVLK